MRITDREKNSKIIQEKIVSMSEYLKEHKYPIVKIKAEELITYFEGDAPSGDTTTLEQVLQSKWLLVHELVEISELKKQGYTIAFDLLVSKPTVVFQAHLIATDWEFQLARKEADNEWIRKRLNDVKNWLDDPNLQSSLSSKCRELLQKYSMKTSNFAKSKRLPLKTVKINDEFWNKRLTITNSSAISYQWSQLEQTHNLDNFRILAGKKQGYRIGFFYCDSDLHKWADAAARILTISDNKKLSKLIREYIDLIALVQQPDGYLYTYNQFHFPDNRWVNLQIEHELYCLGHMIEAAVSYMETNEPEKYKKKFLKIAKLSADLLVADFQNTSPKYTPGHQEIEIALIRLYRYTKEKKYLDLAAHFLKQRGKIKFFSLRLISQAISERKRTREIKKNMEQKQMVNKVNMSFFGGEESHQKEAPFLPLRSTFQYLTGRYLQQNRSIYRMKRPFGHSVRWGYLVTAMAMLYQETGDEKILKALKRTWNHLVQKQMFVTGGIGSLGFVEGFGRDYELNNDSCYCETCAAIASILLNWELALITNEAKYSDLLEWQIYNALSVGIGLDGKSYFYRNLLESDGQIRRKNWFATPCCPSNISRIWASIGEYIYSYNENEIWIHQYIGSTTTFQLTKSNSHVDIQMDSELPWRGKVKLEINTKKPFEFTLNIRIPSWANGLKITINGESEVFTYDKASKELSGSGLMPNKSHFHTITQLWEKNTVIELELSMDVRIHITHPKVKANRKRVALSRGPIVYCFESIDNSSLSISNATIDLGKEIIWEYDEALLEGIMKLFGKDKTGRILTAIPYYSWGNRESSAMQVWIKK